MLESVSPVAGDSVAVLTRDVNVRLLNCSSSGCLLETDAHLAVGTVASLRLTIDGRELVDQIVVVRSQPIEGAGERFHIGAQFLELTPPTVMTVRRALGHPPQAPVAF
jgi:hypothetical protein